MSAADLRPESEPSSLERPRGLPWWGRLALGITALALMAAAAAAYWVRTQLWPELSARLSAPGYLAQEAGPRLAPLGLRLEASDLVLSWPDWSLPVATLEQAQILNDQNQPQAKLEQLRLRLGLGDFWHLAQGRPAFSRMTIQHLDLEISRDAKGRLRLAGFSVSPSDDEPLDLDWVTGMGDLEIETLGIRWRNGRQAGQFLAQHLQGRLGGSRPRVLIDQQGLAPIAAMAKGLFPEISPGLQLGGELKALSLGLDRTLASFRAADPTTQLKALSLTAQLSDLTLETHTALESLRGLAGQLSLDGGAGSLELTSPKLNLVSKAWLHHGEAELEQLDARIRWDLPELAFTAGTDLPTLQRWSVTLDRFKTSGGPIRLDLKGRYQHRGSEERPTLALSGSLGGLLPQDLAHYLPTVIGLDARDWLSTALKSGRPMTGQFRLEGDPHEFPFPQGQGGSFEANLRLDNLRLAYAPGWPVVDQAMVQLRFENARLSMESRQALYGGVPIQSVQAEIPDLVEDHPRLRLKAGLSADLGPMVAVVNDSPVAAMLQNLTVGALAKGPADLGIELDLPLNDANQTKVQGQLQFRQNLIDLGSGIPALEAVKGRLVFSEQGLVDLTAEGRSLGGGFQIHQRAGQTGTALLAKGEVTGPGLEAWLNASLGTPFREVLSGKTDYALSLDQAKGELRLGVTSSLKGLGIRLPAPAAKLPQADWGMSLTMVQQPISPAAKSARASSSSSASNASTAAQAPPPVLRQTWRLNTNPAGKLSVWAETNNGPRPVTRANVGIGVLADPPRQQGAAIRLKTNDLSLDRWLTALNTRLSGGQGSDAGPASPAIGQPSNNGLRQILVEADQAQFAGQAFPRLRASALTLPGGWQIDLQSDNARGLLFWLNSGGLNGQLTRLWLSKDPAEPTASNDRSGPAPLTSIADALTWPSLNLTATDFRFQGKALGSLNLQAQPRPSEKSWRIDLARLENPGGQLELKGSWAPSPEKSTTSLQVILDIRDADQFLTRLGSPGLVKGAAGRIQGQVNWAGAPSDFALASLRGALSLNLAEGQFLKADPGFAKLISVLNLQSLSRRISLDFRDIFAEGFAFERVRGDLSLNRGEAKTTNLRMVGVQASVLIDGQANLLQETQDLQILVLPEVNAGLASLGYALINPAIGLASFLAQYVLRDPLRQALSFQYRVTGPWDDPKVEELPKAAAAAVSR